MQLFRDRSQAGQELAKALYPYRSWPNPVVLALPRGGVPVAYEVAKYLHAPLDIFLVRKLGMPGQEEYAMGAIASGGIRILDERIVRSIPDSRRVIAGIIKRETEELERREKAYRGHCPALCLQGKTVFLVDDGLATGSTMRAAIAAVRNQRPASIVVAVPVAAADTSRELRNEVDAVVCARTPEPFHAVGCWYENFPQTSDDEVRDYLKRAEPLREAV